MARLTTLRLTLAALFSLCCATAAAQVLPPGHEAEIQQTRILLGLPFMRSAQMISPSTIHLLEQGLMGRVSKDRLLSGLPGGGTADEDFWHRLDGLYPTLKQAWVRAKEVNPLADSIQALPVEAGQPSHSLYPAVKALEMRIRAWEAPSSVRIRTLLLFADRFYGNSPIRYRFDSSATVMANAEPTVAGKIDCFLSIGDYLQYTSPDYAIENYLKAYDLYLSVNDYRGLGYTEQCIANTYSVIENPVAYDQARFHFERAALDFLKVKDTVAAAFEGIYAARMLNSMDEQRTDKDQFELLALSTLALQFTGGLKTDRQDLRRTIYLELAGYFLQRANRGVPDSAIRVSTSEAYYKASLSGAFESERISGEVEGLVSACYGLALVNALKGDLSRAEAWLRQENFVAGCIQDNYYDARVVLDRINVLATAGQYRKAQILFDSIYHHDVPELLPGAKMELQNRLNRAGVQLYRALGQIDSSDYFQTQLDATRLGYIKILDGINKNETRYVQLLHDRQLIKSQKRLLAASDSLRNISNALRQSVLRLQGLNAAVSRLRDSQQMREWTIAALGRDIEREQNKLRGARKETAKEIQKRKVAQNYLTLWLVGGAMLLLILSHRYYTTRQRSKRELRKLELENETTELDTFTKIHDISNHLATAAGLVKQGQSGQAVQYYESGKMYYSRLLDGMHKPSWTLQDEKALTELYFQSHGPLLKPATRLYWHIERDAWLHQQFLPGVLPILVHNSLKYAFPATIPAPCIDITITAEQGCLKTIVRDNGEGRPVERFSPRHRNRHGLSLISRLADLSFDLQRRKKPPFPRFTISSSKAAGTVITFFIPLL